MRTAFEREGDVRSVDLPGAFAALWRERANGVLSFSRPESRVRFEILDGAVVGATSSDPSFDAAEVLVRAGKLDPAVFEGRRISRGRDRARFARDEGLLTERDWRWGEKIRAVEILSDLVGWLEGRYSFDAEESPEPGEIRVGIDRLLLELFLRSRDREFVHQSLGAVDAPLQRAADFDEAFPSLGLTADAESVAAAIDGRATAAEISRRVPPDPFSVEKLLAALTTLGGTHLVTFSVAVLRAFNAVEIGDAVMPVLRQLRHPLWSPASPKGFSDATTDWADPDSLLNRAELARSVARRLRLQRLEPRDLVVADGRRLAGAHVVADVRAEPAGLVHARSHVRDEPEAAQREERRPCG